MGLHTIPDKCNLQWNNKYVYNLPYKIFVSEIVLLNWSRSCCTRLTHHKVHQTETDRNSIMIRRHYTLHAQKQNLPFSALSWMTGTWNFYVLFPTSWCNGKCVQEKLYRGPLVAVRKESIFITTITPASCQAIGIQFSDHIELHVDCINIGGRWDSIWLWILSGPGD